MQIELKRVKQVDKPLLRQLLELYLYDFSEFDLADVNEHGYYGYPYLDHYWTEPNRPPYFIKVDDQLAGFALVRQLPAQAPVTMSVAEFFVMRKYRGKGVGKVAAFEVFEKFPGRWEVSQHGANNRSTHHVLKDYFEMLNNYTIFTK